MPRFAVIFAGFAALGALLGAGPAQAETLSPRAVELAQATRPLVSGERVRVQKLARDMESTMQTIDQGGVAPFQDPAYVQKWQKAIEQYRTSLQKYPQVDDPDVQAAAAKLAELENMVAFGINKAAKQQTVLGDVQANLATIEKFLRENPAPQWLPAPFDDEEARQWLLTASRAKNIAQTSITEIQRIAPVAYLPLNPSTVQQGAPYDRQDLDRLLNWANDTIRKADEAVKQTASTLKFQFDSQHETLDYFRQLDPEDPSDRANAFLTEGVEEGIYSRLDDELAFARSVVAYQRAFGNEPAAHTVARVEEIEGLRRTYAENRLKALGDSKLPEPKSEDEARIAIAQQVLANPSYEFGQHGPIVLTTKDVVEREKQVSRAEIKDVDVSLSGTVTLSGTETSWHYKWQEFKFATPLKETENDDWYIWWITAKNFSSGGERTPIGEWVSGAATQGDLILEENF